MRRRQSGFTLIELMIVVAIIGIIASIAIPMYKRYVIRSQISEGLELASGAKTAIAEFHMNRGGWPADNTAAALPAANTITGRYTQSVQVTNNVIVIQFGIGVHTDIVNGTVSLTAVDNNGSVSWTCTNVAIVQPEHLPAACR